MRLVETSKEGVPTRITSRILAAWSSQKRRQQSSKKEDRTNRLDQSSQQTQSMSSTLLESGIKGDEGKKGKKHGVTRSQSFDYHNSIPHPYLPSL